MSLSAVPAGLVGVAVGRPLSSSLAEQAANADTGCDDEDAAAPCEDEGVKMKARRQLRFCTLAPVLSPMALWELRPATVES